MKAETIGDWHRNAEGRSGAEGARSAFGVSFGLRLDASERARLAAVAWELGVKPSTLLRAALHDAIGGAPVQLCTAELVKLSSALVELKRALRADGITLALSARCVELLHLVQVELRSMRAVQSLRGARIRCAALATSAPTRIKPRQAGSEAASGRAAPC